MSRTTEFSLEVLILLFSFVVTTSHHCCSVANMAWDRLVSVGRMLTMWGFSLAVKTALTFIAGVKKAGLDVHDIARATGCADVLGHEVSPTNSYCSGTGKRIARIRAVSRTVSSRRRISGRAMARVNGSRVFSGAHQSWCSLNPREHVH